MLPTSPVANQAWFGCRRRLPEFQGSTRLPIYLAQVTDKVIRNEAYRDTGDADEVPEPAKLGNSKW